MTISRTNPRSTRGRLICMVEKSRSLLACHANATTAFASLTKILFSATVYPGRELFAFLLFVFAIITSVVWGGWHLRLLILTALI